MNSHLFSSISMLHSKAYPVITWKAIVVCHWRGTRFLRKPVLFIALIKSQQYLFHSETIEYDLSLLGRQSPELLLLLFCQQWNMIYISVYKKMECSLTFLQCICHFAFHIFVRNFPHKCSHNEFWGTIKKALDNLYNNQRVHFSLR